MKDSISISKRNQGSYSLIREEERDMKLPYWNVDTDWTSMMLTLRKSIFYAWSNLFGKQTGQNSREDLLPRSH